MTRPRQRGYSLIEVLVAFAVLALALTVLLGTLRNASEQMQWSERAGRAAMHARSVLDEHTTARVLETGRTSGEFEQGRIRWTLDISEYADPDPLLQQRQMIDPSTLRLLQLELAMEFGDGPRDRLELRTLRLMRPRSGAGLGPP